MKNTYMIKGKRPIDFFIKKPQHESYLGWLNLKCSNNWRINIRKNYKSSRHFISRLLIIKQNGCCRWIVFQWLIPFLTTTGGNKLSVYSYGKCAWIFYSNIIHKRGHTKFRCCASFPMMDSDLAKVLHYSMRAWAECLNPSLVAPVWPTSLVVCWEPLRPYILEHGVAKSCV